MVHAFFERISAPIRGLHQAAYVLALLTLASSALALLRDRVFAHSFGAGHTPGSLLRRVSHTRSRVCPHRVLW